MSVYYLGFTKNSEFTVSYKNITQKAITILTIIINNVSDKNIINNVNNEIKLRMIK